MATTTEVLRGPEYYVEPERYLDNYRPCERQEQIEDIDFERHIDEGRTVFMLDAEGTFVWKDGWIVDETIQKRLNDARDYARSQGKSFHLFVATNKKPHDEADLWQMQAWASQIGAEQLFTPLQAGQSKPSPYMLLQAMEYMDTHHPDEALGPENYAMVDDKLSAGIAAANFIGVYSILVNRRGDTDLSGDRVRRLIEEKFLERYGAKGTPSTPTPSDASHAARYKQKHDQDGHKPGIKLSMPEGYTEKILVHGFDPNEPVIQLSDYRLGQLRPGPGDSVIGPTGRGLGAFESFIFDNEFVKQYGDVIADILTELRPILMHEAAQAIREGDKKKALAFYLAAWATDFLDGKFARASNRGPSEEGAIRDYTLDKESAEEFDLAMVDADRMPEWAHRGVRAREVLRKVQRAIAKKQGLDTSATKCGKHSTLVQAAVGGYAIAEDDPTKRALAYLLMVESKTESLLLGMAEWRLRDLRRQFAAETMKHAAQNGTLRDLQITIEKPARVQKMALVPRALGRAGISQR